ncbi:Rpn family recombination-promoting nuclease/putative transposase [Aureispira anguillae]|uniref:Rpn family recombination-promoting nuclease/putative transposase n=1 Tax=Aureispira anguillae TaxID=2864201 RepID=A0A915YBC8_9BACT|nr:Rpn family recombination-promoting nuclease/putative transposase [Aureispira anguillae]BDS09947.1 Rpn family recombination-promoting nuclease/putative transposase [Aureispira anguillae]
MNLKDKYINPLTDFGFKKLFGIEPNKELLIDFLNQLLPSFHQIKNLSYTKNEHLGNTPLERKAIFDLYCESASGEKFIVEVQKAKQNFFKDRSVFYSTFPIQEQAKKGDWDFQLAAVYTIGILDFVFDEHKDRDDILHTVKLKDHKNRLFYDKLTYIYIELPKFTKEVAQLESKFDKWLYIFRHLANLQNRPIALQERIFQKLFEAAEIAKFSPKEKQLYEESLKYYRDLKNVVDTSKAEGIEEGIKKGRQDVAKEMKADGFSVSKIAQYTGLSEDEINRL